MSKRVRGKSDTVLWLLGILVCIGVALIGYYVVSTRGREVRPSSKPAVPPPRVEVREEAQITLYVPKETADGFVLVPELRPFHGGGSKVDEALRALLASNQEVGIVQNLIPQRTMLLGSVRIKDGIAEVNLSKSFVDNFVGGSDQEALTLNAIVATVVSNSGGEAKRVRITVDGASVESLGGHFDLTGPLSPDPQIVKSEKGN